MAAFPSLIPSDAPITPGAWPSTTTSSLNGAESRIRHGSAVIGGRWRPQFINITETDFLAILSHYRGQRSGFDSFGFNTITLAADRTPAGFAWLYAGPPQVVDQHLDCFTVQCEFKCEPRGLVVVPGGTWRTEATRFAEIDPHFSSVSLLLEFEGTTFADLGPLELPVVLEFSGGGGGITTELAAVGSSSFRVADSQLRLPVHSALELSGDFTIEWTPRHTSTDNKQLYFCNFNGTNVQIGYIGALYFYTTTGEFYRTLSLSVNTWDALMVSRSGSTLYWFKNGTLLGTATDTRNYNLSGGNIARNGSQNMVGFIDHIRITKGICRATSDYLVSPGPFPRG
jgi:hypothetical protein